MSYWGTPIKESHLLEGSNLAYKENGIIVVSPFVASRIRTANKKELQIIIRNIKLIDLDSMKERL